MKENGDDDHRDTAMTITVTVLGSCRQYGLRHIVTCTNVQEHLSYPHSTKEALQALRLGLFGCSDCRTTAHLFSPQADTLSAKTITGTVDRTITGTVAETVGDIGAVGAACPTISLADTIYCFRTPMMRKRALNEDEVLEIRQDFAETDFFVFEIASRKVYERRRPCSLLDDGPSQQLLLFCHHIIMERTHCPFPDYEDQVGEITKRELSDEEIENDILEMRSLIAPRKMLIVSHFAVRPGKRRDLVLLLQDVCKRHDILFLDPTTVLHDDDHEDGVEYDPITPFEQDDTEMTHYSHFGQDLVQQLYRKYFEQSVFPMFEKNARITTTSTAESPSFATEANIITTDTASTPYHRNDHPPTTVMMMCRSRRSKRHSHSDDVDDGLQHHHQHIVTSAIKLFRARAQRQQERWRERSSRVIIIDIGCESVSWWRRVCTGSDVTIEAFQADESAFFGLAAEKTDRHDHHHRDHHHRHRSDARPTTVHLHNCLVGKENGFAQLLHCTTDDSSTTSKSENASRRRLLTRVRTIDSLEFGQSVCMLRISANVRVACLSEFSPVCSAACSAACSVVSSIPPPESLTLYVINTIHGATHTILRCMPLIVVACDDSAETEMILDCLAQDVFTSSLYSVSKNNNKDDDGEQSAAHPHRTILLVPLHQR